MEKKLNGNTNLELRAGDGNSAAYAAGELYLTSAGELFLYVQQWLVMI